MRGDTLMGSHVAGTRTARFGRTSVVDRSFCSRCETKIKRVASIANFEGLQKYLNYPVGQSDLLPQENDEAEEEESAPVRQVAGHQAAHDLGVCVLPISFPVLGCGKVTDRKIIRTDFGSKIVFLFYPADYPDAIYYKRRLEKDS